VTYSFTLSERRANNVKEYVTSDGLQAAAVTSVGLGSAAPLTKEVNPDGSVSPEGQAFNRRVEIVVRVP
jgi:outer membrane protein OmpA-like peptidoglycan-associated protein